VLADLLIESQIVGNDSIRDAWQLGRTAWPTVELELGAFASFVGKLVPEEATRFPADIYLAAACVARNPEAIAAFDRELLVPARATIRSIDARDEFIDEALQRLRTRLFVGDGDGDVPRIASYAGRGSLRAWIGVLAARTALMMQRSQRRAKEIPAAHGDGEDWASALATIATSNPELELLKQQYAAAFSAALRDAIHALEPRLRAALRLSFVDDVSIDEIAAVYSVHRATAARWIQRACDAVFEHTRNDLAGRLALSGTELDRMTALIHSQLDVSVSQLLFEHGA